MEFKEESETLDSLQETADVFTAQETLEDLEFIKKEVIDEEEEEEDSLFVTSGLAGTSTECDNMVGENFVEVKHELMEDSVDENLYLPVKVS